MFAPFKEIPMKLNRVVFAGAAAVALLAAVVCTEKIAAAIALAKVV